jgi:transcriptional regulator with XRE-family HTH domain
MLYHKFVIVFGWVIVIMNMEVVYMMHGERIRTLRKDAGLTQEDLAKALDMTGSMISEYENNQVPDVRTSTIRKFAEYFRVSFEYLAGDSCEQELMLEEICRTYAALSDNSKTALLKYAKYLQTEDQHG